MSTEAQPLSAAEEAKKYVTRAKYFFFVYLIMWLLSLLCYYRLGNEFFSAKKYDEAIIHYTTAIAEDPENAVYYSNRR
jgi:tetratricopeptide (TPR) repeat protein